MKYFFKIINSQNLNKNYNKFCLYDRVLLFLFFILITIGFINIFSASAAIIKEPFFLLKKKLFIY